ncbi:hypothetical protein BD779DRAFT_1569471 [Infundibulicybe gibba]|nr:hypothetical protein BD779DRAFT_1569471 [Infundibulicybe gibba]
MPAVHPAFLFSLHGLLIADSSAPRAGDCCSDTPPSSKLTPCWIADVIYCAQPQIAQTLNIRQEGCSIGGLGSGRYNK